MPKLRPAETRPLFILGCVRSGTTLMRDLLRRQPATICPEETHYFRYGEPFRTNAYGRTLTNSKTLARHREIDGIPAEAFEQMYREAETRGELLCAHVEHMARQRGLEQYRWFDKTPQNVYGIAMIRAEFPQARFLHLVRNPLNVVASLKLGKVMKVPDLIGACNYWIEAITVMRQFAPVLGDALLEVRYEDLTDNTLETIGRILAFSGLGDRLDLYNERAARPERNRYAELLTPEEQATVRRLCGPLAALYGYELGQGPQDS